MTIVVFTQHERIKLIDKSRRVSLFHNVIKLEGGGQQCCGVLSVVRSGKTQIMLVLFNKGFIFNNSFCMWLNDP